MLDILLDVLLECFCCSTPIICVPRLANRSAGFIKDSMTIAPPVTRRPCLLPLLIGRSSRSKRGVVFYLAS